MILAETFTSLLVLPLWIWFSDRIGKHRTLTFAGAWVGLWGLAIKMAIGLGVFLGTSLPALYGFEPSAASLSNATEFALMRIYGWLPCFIMLLAFPLLWNYPITQKKQLELRAEIEARRRFRIDIFR